MKRPIWFKRKIYGWGWTPATWQGWAIIGIFTGVVITLAMRIDSNTEPTNAELANFFVPLFGLTVLLLVITYLTGEKPRWQWGRTKDEE